jgi:hypothetical protein
MLEEAAVAAADRWVRHPAVRAAAEDEWWRAGATAALAELEAVVGPLGQRDVSWLVLRALKAVTWYADGTTDPVPAWSADPHVGAAGAGLLRVVTLLARGLETAGVPLDSKDNSDRLVLAQLITCGIPWDSADLVRDILNVGSVGSVRSDGRGIEVGRHAGDSEVRALDSLRRRRLPKIRSAYPEREGWLDGTLRTILAEHPDATADSIFRAVAAGEPWATEPLLPFYDTLDRSVVQRALERLRRSPYNEPEKEAEH